MTISATSARKELPSVAGPALLGPDSRSRLPFAIFGYMALDALNGGRASRVAGAVSPGDRGEPPLVVVAADEALAGDAREDRTAGAAADPLSGAKAGPHAKPPAEAEGLLSLGEAAKWHRRARRSARCQTRHHPNRRLRR